MVDLFGERENTACVGRVICFDADVREFCYHAIVGVDLQETTETVQKKDIK